MRVLIVIGIMVSVLLLAGVACTTQQGSGTVTTESRDVRGFNQVQFEGFGTVIINQGDRESLEIEAEDNITPQIRTKVENQILKIDFRTNTMHPTKPIIFRLTVKDLKALDFSGAANVQASNLNATNLELTFSGAGSGNLDGLRTDSLKTTITGAGKVTASGTTTTQEARIDGAGEYLAGDLQSKNATVDVNGAGKATVRVSDDLNVQISGAGSVDYYGNPRVTQNISGAGRVNKLGGS